MQGISKLYTKAGVERYNTTQIQKNTTMYHFHLHGTRLPLGYTENLKIPRSSPCDFQSHCTTPPILIWDVQIHLPSQ